METINDDTARMSVTGPTGRRRLLRFDDIEVGSLTAGSFTCRVTLSGPRNRVFMGEGTSFVSGVASTAAARATLRAIELYAGARFTLVSIRKTHVGERDLILVIVSVSTHPRVELTGAVIIQGDETRTAALAVLDATNRWLEMHTSQGYSPAEIPVDLARAEMP